MEAQVLPMRHPAGSRFYESGYQRMKATIDLADIAVHAMDSNFETSYSRDQAAQALRRLAEHEGWNIHPDTFGAHELFEQARGYLERVARFTIELDVSILSPGVARLMFDREPGECSECGHPVAWFLLVEKGRAEAAKRPKPVAFCMRDLLKRVASLVETFRCARCGDSDMDGQDRGDELAMCDACREELWVMFAEDEGVAG